VDSSGAGPSDHTSFYRAGVPVLFVFTGLHTDYHKPSDDAEKLNYDGETQVLRYVYNIVEQMDKQPKPKFKTTKEATVGKVRFKVTLGIMPDYSFQEGGVKVDGVTDGKPAIKAGIKAGDIITQLGSHKVNGMQTYMEALGAFKEGDKTEVTIIRGEDEIKLPIEFK
jgi:C-terminal processing protease CtpA/Prc